ncbi:porin [Azohydromonas caseinilytica]|uniref:Porin n=1 Tax=Azohydromonas caseinilytica TaxID=2728836 RepID=A0A848FIL8_9BURK|nr:porin [Azohydromonas caseinilytica]NML18996.1 porin [Azohydromonas caseinilytica]
MKLYRLQGLAAAALLACAGGTAVAQDTNVQLFGLVDVGVGRLQEPGSAAVYRVENGRMTTSHWGLRGTEELGGGLQAVFSLESFFRADTGATGRFDGDSFFARNAYVGLAGTQWGSVRLGRNTTPLFVSTISFNAFGDSYGFSPTVRHVFLPNAVTAPVTGDSAWSDSVLYSTPTWGGFRANAIVAAGEQNGGRNWSASAVYGAGPLGATLVFQDVKKGATVPDSRTWQAGLSWDFNVAKVFAQHTRAESRGVTPEAEYRLTDVTAAIPVGGGGSRVLAGYGLLDRSTGRDRRTFSFGYDHQFSKRTDLYAMAMQDKDEAAATRQTARSWAVGVRHRF